MNDRAEYNRWKKAVREPDLKRELEAMNASEAEDAFYRDLSFGTGGLRGIIGAGTNRMNVYVVARASQGLADYLHQASETASVVIGYDSRIKSDEFARKAAEVFAGNGIQVHIWPTLLPVPTVSYAVRALGASAGVMITASHNPAQYNGYKVYGPDGCQITTEAAAEILAKINSLDMFDDIRASAFENETDSGMISYIDDSVLSAFLEEVKSQSVLFGDEVDRNAAIVYSPLNGTGLVPVTRVLEESGFTSIRNASTPSNVAQLCSGCIPVTSKNLIGSVGVTRNSIVDCDGAMACFSSKRQSECGDHRQGKYESDKFFHGFLSFSIIIHWVTVTSSLRLPACRFYVHPLFRQFYDTRFWLYIGYIWDKFPTIFLKFLSLQKMSLQSQKPYQVKPFIGHTLTNTFPTISSSPMHPKLVARLSTELSRLSPRTKQVPIGTSKGKSRSHKPRAYSET